MKKSHSGCIYIQQTDSHGSKQEPIASTKHDKRVLLFWFLCLFEYTTRSESTQMCVGRMYYESKPKMNIFLNKAISAE